VIALEQLLNSSSKALQVLILAPTREVAIQICDVIKSIGVNCGSQTKCGSFIGGNSVKNDKIKLKTCQIAVGTPGRILHLINDNMLNVTNIRLFIMDEADKLLAPEFQETIK
jgi:ATP-dependent RNA helicase DDX20